MCAPPYICFCVSNEFHLTNRTVNDLIQFKPDCFSGLSKFRRFVTMTIEVFMCEIAPFLLCDYDKTVFIKSEILKTFL